MEAEMTQEELYAMESDDICEPSGVPAWAECAIGVFFAVVWVLGLCLLACSVGGCVGTKASHQNGIVLYVSTSGQIGVGYGETEDLPGGCTFRREVVQYSPAFWGDGTNYTRTVTEWDTTAMITATNTTAGGTGFTPSVPPTATATATATNATATAAAEAQK